MLPIFGRLFQSLQNLNNAAENISNLSETADKADKGVTVVSKVLGVTVGASGAAKGTADVISALACQDGICAVISGIGVCADTLSMATSMVVPGPNATSVITIPVSTFCKVFVWCCKNDKDIPFGGC